MLDRYPLIAGIVIKGCFHPQTRAKEILPDALSYQRDGGVCCKGNITTCVIFEARQKGIDMDGNMLRAARQNKAWTQKEAARALGVTQAYLSMLEKGRRKLSEAFVRKALKVLNLPPTALPLRREDGDLAGPSQKRDFSMELSSLGYPRFAYLRTRRRRNPAEVLLDALNQSNLDARVAEGLPWLALTYVDMDWDWLVRNAKVHDRQNRLGFAVSLASEVSESKNDNERTKKLRASLEKLESARLAREDTFCHDSMTQAERKWLRQHRSPAATHWNVLTDMKGEDLAYSSR
jgi:transcriptional regulator with XRE-family HTH domain